VTPTLLALPISSSQDSKRHEEAFMMGKLHKNADVVAGVIEELKGHLAQYRVA